MPGDLTDLEARLALLSAFTGYCLLGLADLGKFGARQREDLQGRVDSDTIIPMQWERAALKTDRGWGNGGGYGGLREH
jgi:hypothetical protein